ncbi:IMPACT family protein [Stenotrophomonas nematodicola]|uniref:YigZ family protein n=1 Tax=Stenotrophomonas nematodicola TaxID=2656746 RepID=A0ABW7D1J1_9GAMM
MPDTLATVVSHSLEIKHSRFIAHAAPIDDAAAALAFLQQVAVADATHNCWAYRHGSEYRSSDDGEPAGTAGRPILAAIDGQGFDRVVVVVIRWYGGIKLGAGGLVRAYGGTAAECLRIAPRLPLVALATLRLQAGFDDLGALHAALAAHGAEKQAETFTASGVEMRLQLPADQADPLKNRLRDATRDRIRIETCTEPGHLND